VAEKIKNQAEIDAANRRIAAAEKALAEAQAVKTSFAATNKETIISGISGLSKGISDFTKALQSGISGRGLKEYETAAKTAISTSQQITGELNPQLKTIEQNISTAAADLAGIRVPAPIYETSSQSDMLTADAFALIEMTFKMYGLDELSPILQQLMEEGVSPQRAALLLKTDPKYNRDAAGNPIGYQKRFYGNELRRQAGLNVLSEDAYIALEDSYSETLKEYGQQNFFGLARDTRQRKMADIIAADISAKEFQDRVILAVNRVQNSDVMTRKTLNSFYGVTDNDLVSYFLNPKEQLPVLQQKVASAEIGGAALSQGLEAVRLRSEELAKLGVSKEQAQTGYSALAQILPTATKLSDIYRQEGITYTQTTGEQEAFENLASARRARETLVARELGAYSGRSGIGKGALSNKGLGSI
jgi:hypothetical protein